ncbi:MAG TPA: ATP-binding protein [Dehalococcoidia bacterium]|nr:ATP-binding protein [Dehalococcoidia bacterium]
MTADRSRLRLVNAPQPAADAPPNLLDAALQLAGSDRGAIVRRADDGRIELQGSGLSPEEEAACTSLARRLWQQTVATAPLASTLGGGTLLAQPLPSSAASAPLSAALVVALPAGASRDPARIAALRRVSAVLAPALEAGERTRAVAAQAATERRRAERLLALNHALQALADTDDAQLACVKLLDDLAPQFPGIDMWAVWLLEADDSRLRMVASRGESRLRTPVHELPLDTGYSFDSAIHSGQLVVQSYGKGAARTPDEKLAKRMGIVSIAHVPLKSRSAVAGLLTLAARTARPLPEDERTFLETVGAQLGSQLDALRQLERAEAESERLQALIEALPVGIAMFDAQGNATLSNQAIADLLGVAPSGNGRRRGSGHALLTADGRPLPPEESPLCRVLNDGTAQLGRELVVRRADTGEDVPVLVNAAPFRDGSGRLTGVVTVYQDISRLREVDRLKDDFINTVSHELRTPTTTVRGGALTLLKRGHQLDASVREQLLHDMAEEAERLYHLVEDLLGMQRVQAGMQLQLEPTIPYRFVNDVIISLGGRVGNHALTVDVPSDLPLVDADPTYLEQVFRNLLENAVKFSPRGRRIEITAALDGKNVEFSVLDRGSGIPKEDMDRVFEPFYKTADAVRTGSQGAGLGLAVCRRLIEVMGGRIWAQARPGGGTAFRFTLPVLQEDGAGE